MKRFVATALLALGLLQGAAGAADETQGAAQVAAEQAKAEAARKLRAQASEFTVVAIEPTQWSDSSLGCGKPGAMRTDVMIEGYTVVLERQGKRHQVNVGGSRTVMCDNAGRLDGPRQPMSARQLERMTALARRDLANRLRLDTQQVRVAKVEARSWTDDDMNCASGGGAAANAADAAGPRQDAGTGYRLELSASGRTYFYHTDLRSVRACPPGQ